MRGAWQLAEKYASLLEAYVEVPSEVLRERAYELAHEAMAHGQGVLDLTAAHREALLKMLVRARTPRESEQIVTRASEFLLETLVPFEMTHRGYQETIDNLSAANEALRVSEESNRNLAKNMKLLLESTDQGMYRIDLDAKCTLVNRAGAAMAGYKPEEMLGKNIHELIHHTRPDGSPYPVALCPVVRAIRVGQGVRVDNEVFWRRDGTSFPVEYSSYPIVEGGVTKGAVVTFFDISERKHAEEERARFARERAARAATEDERALLEAVVRQMPAGVVIVEAPSGKLVLGNERMEAILREPFAAGAGVEQIYRRKGFHADGRPYEYEEWPLTRSLRTGEVVVNEEIDFLRGDGTRGMLRASSAPIRERAGRIVAAVTVIDDITEQIEFDRLKDQFIFVAAHELNTPVAIVKGYAEALLKKAGEVPPPQRKLLEAIDRGSDRIDRIVRDLLDISALVTGGLELRMERIDLSEIVQEVVDRMASASTKHRVRLSTREPVAVQGDCDRLKQVLANLIDNSIKFSPMGGDVELAVDVSDHEAVVSVTDRGVGIPKEKQKRIFERFYRAHTGTPYDYGGMGVGLFLSREIISRHGGRMWFESEEGKGSVFQFVLPAA
ncbi:MAG: PAS domain S-box protein [Chloroflexi bacterium]|nr:PAS domain S-box protein [Chloroflexota bacterium]